MKDNILDFYHDLSAFEIELLKKHLVKRFKYNKKRDCFNIVFDILHECNLCCLGCGTNSFYNDKVSKCFHCSNIISLENIEKVLIKCKDFAESKHKKVFINFGGGEPFLREDILDVLKLASRYFGAESIGIDTNGTLNGIYELISNAMPYLSYIGISINGLHNYHNWWTNITSFDAFERSLNTVELICKNPEWSNKLEVTSIATKNNLHDIVPLMELLISKGVKNYSIHRAIPVGRMWNYSELVPSAKEYLNLLISVLKYKEKDMINVHLHHSIEAIHASLLCGINTYHESIGTPDKISSLCIGTDGNLLFDPWCTTGFWKTLTWGNLIFDGRKLEEIITEINDEHQYFKQFTSKDQRCMGCEYNCSGGSRIVAAATKLMLQNKHKFSKNEINVALKNIDPACPKY